MKKQLGLLGYPLSHSFSKEYFTNKFKDLGITDEIEYKNFEIDDISLLPDILNKNHQLVGLNVTIPYKQAVIPFIKHLSKEVTAIGAVNTISIDRKSGLVLSGANSDCIGFEKSLLSFIGDERPDCLIFGTGGSSMAVRYVLDGLGIKHESVSRKPEKEKNQRAYSSITESDILRSKLLINTTPLGMYPNIIGKPDIPYEAISEMHYLFDLVYNPGETLFLTKGFEQKAKIKNGLEMLTLQAEAAWDIWKTSVL